jgi:hypothetical protein
VSSQAIWLLGVAVIAANVTPLQVLKTHYAIQANTADFSMIYVASR